jgi:hypothetical protein
VSLCACADVSPVGDDGAHSSALPGDCCPYFVFCQNFTMYDVIYEHGLCTSVGVYTNATHVCQSANYDARIEWHRQIGGFDWPVQPRVPPSALSTLTVRSGVPPTAAHDKGEHAYVHGPRRRTLSCTCISRGHVHCTYAWL